MPTTAFALQDDRLHDVRQGLERELCSLSLLPPFTGGASVGAGGDWVVLVTGELHSLQVSFNVRLSVFRFGGPLAASVDYSVWRGSIADLIASTPCPNSGCRASRRRWWWNDPRIPQHLSPALRSR